MRNLPELLYQIRLCLPIIMHLMQLRLRIILSLKLTKSVKQAFLYRLRFRRKVQESAVW